MDFRGIASSASELAVKIREKSSPGKDYCRAERMQKILSRNAYPILRCLSVNWFNGRSLRNLRYVSRYSLSFSRDSCILLKKSGASGSGKAFPRIARRQRRVYQPQEVVNRISLTRYLDSLTSRRERTFSFAQMIPLLHSDVWPCTPVRPRSLTIDRRIEARRRRG